MTFSNVIIVSTRNRRDQVTYLLSTAATTTHVATRPRLTTRHLQPSAAISNVMPPRRAKSQSISSDTPTPKSSPLSKPATPVKAPSRRSPPSSPITAAYQAIADPVRRSQIPSALQFPLIVVLSFSFSSLLFSIVAETTAGDLAAISKHTESWLEITGLLAWKALQLAVCWFGGFDGNIRPGRVAGKQIADGA